MARRLTAKSCSILFDHIISSVVTGLSYKTARIAYIKNTIRKQPTMTNLRPTLDHTSPVACHHDIYSEARRVLKRLQASYLSQNEVGTWQLRATVTPILIMDGGHHVTGRLTAALNLLRQKKKLASTQPFSP